MALEIQHLSGVIIEKVNRFFGWRAVGRIRIRQAPLARRKAKTPSTAPDPAVVARLAAGMTDIATKTCAARSPGWAPRSSERERPDAIPHRIATLP